MYLTVLEGRGPKRVLQGCNQGVGRTAFLLEASVSLLFPASRGNPHSLAHGLFLHLQSKSPQPLLPYPFLTSTLLPHSLKGPLWLIAQDHVITKIIQDNVSISSCFITSTKYFLPQKVTYSQGLWITMCYLSGGIILSTIQIYIFITRLEQCTCINFICKYFF